MATVTKPIALDESLNTTESPSRNVADVLAEELQNIASAIGGGGSGGHTIIDPDGQDMTQRAGMQFADLHLSDDGVNDKTVVEAFEVLADESDFDDLDESDAENDGAYLFENDGVPLDDSMVAHGTETVRDVLNRIGYLSGLRFKNLGTSFTAEQQAKLASGDLTDFWNGDYWVDEAQGVVWRIVDNTGIFRKTGDTEFDSPSIVIMPDNPLINSTSGLHLMNDSDSTGGGYQQTKYRTTYRSQCRTMFDNFFGSAHIANHREQLSVSSGCAWTDCDIELPSELNLFGSTIFGNGGFNVSSVLGQFRLFALAPYFIVNRDFNFWLRDAKSGSDFCAVSKQGGCWFFGASYTWCDLMPYGIII